MLESARDPRIAGFTTNPTLMRKAGVTDYRGFAREVLAAIRDQPDLVRGVRRRLRRDGASGARDRELGRQRVRQDPGHEHAAASRRTDLIRELASGRRQAERHRDVHARAGARASRARSRAARRRVHLGVRRPHRRHRPRPDPADARGARDLPRCRRRIELIWASPRELLNIVQAAEIGCDIITVTHDLLAKLPLVGKDLDAVLARDRADVPPRRRGRRIQAVSDDFTKSYLDETVRRRARARRRARSRRSRPAWRACATAAGACSSSASAARRRTPATR